MNPLASPQVDIWAPEAPILGPERANWPILAHFGPFWPVGPKGLEKLYHVVQNRFRPQPNGSEPPKTSLKCPSLPKNSPFSPRYGQFTKRLPRRAPGPAGAGRGHRHAAAGQNRKMVITFARRGVFSQLKKIVIWIRGVFDRSSTFLRPG